MISDFRMALALLEPDQRRQAVWLVALMLIGMVFETLGVGMIIPVLGLLTGASAGQDSFMASLFTRALGPELSHLGLIQAAMLTMGGLFFAKFLFLAGMYWLQFRFVYGIQARLSYRLLRQYLSEPMSFHLQRNSADLIRNATLEVQFFSQGAVMASLIFVTEFCVAIGIAGLLLVTEPVGALCVILAIGVASFGFLRLTRSRLSAWGQVRQEADGRKIQYIQQGLGGIKTVKVLGRENSFLRTFAGPNKTVARIGVYQNFVGALPRIWLELVAVLGLVVLVLVMLFRGREVAELAPILGLFAIAAFRLLPSANRLVGAAQNVRFNRPAIAVLNTELRPYTAPVPDAVQEPLQFETALSVEGLQFSYTGQERASLQDISFQVQKGQCFGIIGQSGAGKSTLIDLVLGILTPQSGQIKVDATDISQNMAAWRRMIGYVPQDIYLTDNTLRENIAFGVEPDQIDDTTLWAAIKAAQLESVVDQAELGLETIVGERGIRLSGGQRQRIGIARALYHDPEVLVLDEATSALDVATERSVMDAIHAMKGQKTILIVTHRLSTLEQADTVLELQDGRIKSLA